MEKITNKKTPNNQVNNLELHLERLDGNNYQVTVLSGELKLKELRIGSLPALKKVSLKAGESVDINSSKKRT